MAFQWNQIDAIADEDEALSVLETEYIPALLDALTDSPEGQAYLTIHPNEADYFGDWSGNFVYFAYAYLNVTLPKLKLQDAEVILNQLFPRKVSLPDPTEADSIIPELITLWQFLQRQYKQRNSTKILAFLHKIQPSYPATMNDPANFGIAKSFLMAGQAAGFDMTTQAGVEAFQQQYNQQIQETGAPPPGFPALPAPQSAATANPLAGMPVPEGVPPEFVAFMAQQMGLGPVPGLEHLPTDQTQLVTAIAQHLLNTGEVKLRSASEPESKSDFWQDLQAHMLQQISEEPGLALSDEAIALLQAQTITATTPGTIVKDFQTLLEAMGDRGVPVSGKLHHLSLKQLALLNEQLSQPIQVALQRPQQKSYPNLHGLYLLLRATGITELVTEGKTTYLKPAPDILAGWQQLNPTEQYFTLLEAWMTRSDEELLGETRSSMNEGTRVLRSWSDFKSRKPTFRNYGEQSNLSYYPGLHNLALMQLFGWVEVTTGKPDAGKGWRVKQVKPLPWGDAIAAIVFQAYVDHNFRWDAATDSTRPWGELQPYFQPYFSEWQQNLPALQPPEHQLGTYLFKVSLGKIWRRLSISSESTLEELGGLVRSSVSFDSDHLDRFSFRDAMGRTVEIHHPYNDWQDVKRTDEVLVGDLPLKPGMSMTYLFDFGDNWNFTLLLEEIQPGNPKRTSNKVIERHGKAPEQYASWDEE